MVCKLNIKLKKTKKLALGVFIGVGVLALTLLFLNNYLENKITKSIEENLVKVNGTFDKVDVKLLDRRAEVVNPSFIIKGKTLKVDGILLDDIQLWDYIINKDIIVGNLNIANPVVKVFNFQKEEKDSSTSKKSANFKNKVLIKNLSIDGGSFQIFEKDSTEHRLFTKIKDIKMEQVRINSETLKETVPFNYDLILLNADSIFYDLNDQHKLAAGSFEIDNNKVLVQNLQIIPKFSKAGHQKTINIEKDRYDLKIDSLSMDSFNWTMQNDSLKIHNSFTRISGVNFDIYRDKLQPDDTSIKPLYGKMIREMPILVNLDSVEVENTYLRYEERMHAERESGVVDFSNLNARIKNITNMGLDREDFPKTVLIATANFMKQAPLKVNMEFDISNRNDNFHITGNMGQLAAEQMNKFMKPAMNVEASGDILDMYFNFYGNHTKASGDMRLEYNDFKVEVLQKDGSKKNKFVSALANLIVKNKAINEKANYKEISFTRDKTKSFWNYLWNLLKNGALKSFL
ncbi:conserved hypothetical protein, membrane or secreted [Christiangramia forsetii KT0803]|uniref:DUF748 domain-containing protein n=1 Tax=Christiangramia forsetii (strain DSM 17595 / CGMCC 1.15422 / KT0803) TaxID=411154 RepID=A0LXP7_CHRFK|nr:conserved hypothetical protein, membrane or secreted [Christiangramia forsetii KT0803]